MREILFRGKGTHSGKWVEGDLLNRGYDYATAIRKVSKFGPEVIGVDPETVGQYTGLTDKNGKKIFEGDILSERPPMNQTAYIGYVAYDEELAVWHFMIKNDTKYNGVLLGSYSRSYKVIGNIHDNPELLEATK